MTRSEEEEIVQDYKKEAEHLQSLVTRFLGDDPGMFLEMFDDPPTYRDLLEDNYTLRRRIHELSTANRSAGGKARAGIFRLRKQKGD
jgi:hypothetical protein